MRSITFAQSALDKRSLRSTQLLPGPLAIWPIESPQKFMLVGERFTMCKKCLKKSLLGCYHCATADVQRCLCLQVPCHYARHVRHSVPGQVRIAPQFLFRVVKLRQYVAADKSICLDIRYIERLPHRSSRSSLRWHSRGVRCAASQLSSRSRWNAFRQSFPRGATSRAA